MRITQNILDRNMLGALAENFERLATLQTQLATGQRIQTFSDDPLGAAQALHLERENERLGAYMKNARNIGTMLQAAADSAQQASETLARTKEYAVQAATGTYSDSDRQSIADGIDNLLQNLVSLGNMQSNGRYIFSGQATDTAAYRVVTDAEGTIVSVAYQGDMLATEVEVGPDLYAQANLVGREFFEGRGDAFGTLIALRDAVRAGDEEQIRSAMGALEGVHAGVAQALGRLGELSRAQVLALTNERFQALNEERLAATRDADIAQLSVDYNSRMALLQIVLQVTAEAQRVSLLDYL